MDRRPASLDRLGHPDRFGNRAGHRQYHLHLDTRGQAAAGAERPRAAARTLARDGHAHTVAAGVGVGEWLVDPLFSVAGHDISGRELILLGGGLFLLWKSVHEIHAGLEGEEEKPTAAGVAKVIFGAI